MMKVNDILEIKGSFGFLWSPRMRVVEVRGHMVLLEQENAQKGGLLSHLNQSWHSIELLNKIGYSK